MKRGFFSGIHMGLEWNWNLSIGGIFMKDVNKSPVHVGNAELTVNNSKFLIIVWTMDFSRFLRLTL